jgi:hypothetical protein
MTAASRCGWTGFIISLAVTVPTACGSIRHDEFACENAVAHLKACCPDFDASAIDCRFVDGCGGTSYPEIDVSQSDCIQAESCDTLRTRGVCAAAQALPYQQGSDEAGAGPLVCPAPPPPAPSVGDAGISVSCTRASDCRAGDVCCATLVGSALGVACSPAPCASGLPQPCGTSSECPAGQTCQLVPAFNVMVCSVPIDAPDEATDSPGLGVDVGVDAGVE